jgi:hypothetical protein
MKRHLGSICFASLLLLGGCGGGSEDSTQPKGTDPFPLSVGNRWDMEVNDMRWSLGTWTDEVSGTRPSDGSTTYVMSKTISATKRDTPYLHTDTGVWRLPPLDATPDELEQGPILILKLPMVVGDRWTQVDKIVDTGNDVDNNGHNEIETTFRYARVDRVETVDTPAGKFDGAFVVTTSDSWTFSDPETKYEYDFSHFTTTEWYVPGVGVVRREVTGIPAGGIGNYGRTEVLKSYHVAPTAM